MNRNVARRNGEYALVDYWYQSRSRTVASDYWNRALLIRDAIQSRRTDGALVRLTAPMTNAADASASIEIDGFAPSVARAVAENFPE
jgi:EpsI family protein